MIGGSSMRLLTVFVLLLAVACSGKARSNAGSSSATGAAPASSTAGASPRAGASTGGPATGSTTGGKTLGSSALAQTIDVTNDPSTVNDVTFTDNTVMIDVPTFKQALRGAASNGQVLVFAPVPEIQKLQPGSVLLVKGVAIRKVLAVMPFEGNIALLLTQGAITDAVKHGHIHVEHEVGLSASSMLPPSVIPDKPPIQLAGLGLGLESPLDLFAYGQGGNQGPAALEQKLSDLAGKVNTQFDSANGGLGACGTTKGEWSYCVGGSRAGSRINLNLSLSKNDHGFIGKIQGNGYLDNFQMATDLDVDDSKLTSFTWDTRNANGQMNFQVTAAKENKDPLSKADFQDAIPLPGSFELTYLVGPIPLSVKVTEALVVRPGFTGMNQIVEANFRLTYNSTQHLSLRAGNIDDNGNVSGLGENLQTNTMLTGPYAFVVAWAGPQIEAGFDAGTVWDELTSNVPDAVVALGKRVAEAFMNWGPVKQILDGPYGPQIQTALNVAEEAATRMIQTKAAVHLNFVLSVSVLSGGMITMMPCQRTTEMVTSTVGADAALFGMSPKDTLKKELFRKTWVQGPKTGPCAYES
jgi:hypothetical protein